MGYDFDRQAAPLANASAVNIAGMLAHYTAGERSFDLFGIYDEAWSQVKMASGRGGALPISTTNPRFNVRDSDFPSGFKAAKGNTLALADGRTFKVSDVQPDGFGMTQLDLIKTN